MAVCKKENYITKLILLPGMDGTGQLFDPMIGLIPASVELEVITLSGLRGHTVESQAYEIAQRIGEQEVVIFAESYSGLIAYELAQMSRVNIRHIIFAASFLARPSYLSKLSFLAPLSVLRSNIVPSFFLSWLFFGSSKCTGLVRLFMQAFMQVSDSLLKERLKLVASLPEPNKQIKIPCTYIQADKDKLVNEKSIKPFQKLCISLQIKKVKGGHFITQSNPKACTEIIVKVLNLYQSNINHLKII